MRFEHISPQHESKKFEASKLASEFSELSLNPSESVTVFEHLEEDLANAGFVLAKESELSQIFFDHTLRTRSESFTKVLNVLLEDEPISLQSKDGDANMCAMASASGFTIAMEEGFSGKDVKGMVKVVVSFNPAHIESEHPIPPSNDLWRTKPDTAEVSLSGSGMIHNEDIRMVSFRFPIRYFPEDLLTEHEQERLVDAKISFVVRHYIHS